MPRKRHNTAPWMAALEAQAAMWTVLGIRVPQLLTGRMSPAEQTRMIAEKAEAIADSQRATAEALGRLMLSPARTPAGIVLAAGRLATAAFDPFHRRVTANAKRLGKPHKRRSF